MTRPSLPSPYGHPTLDVPVAGREFFGFGRAKSYAEAARYEATNGAAGLPVVRFGRSLRAVTAECRRLCGLDPCAPDLAVKRNDNERDETPGTGPDVTLLDQRPSRETEHYPPL